MKQYVCHDCDMAIQNLVCAKCGSELESKSITTDEGNDVQVSQCPNDCGKIKSPMCCGKDMELK